MLIKHLTHHRLLPYAIIAMFAFLLILPQLLTGGFIVGSDAIFHYNRFYDTAMQIKTGHYSYFLSLHGFQQSGRIVNAVYGPLFAYFQGFLVLISKNWFIYQHLSRFAIGLISGLSMYALLRQCRLKQHLALPLALFYVTTFSIQYWSMRQGFSSWGAAILPFCFIPAVQLVRYHKVSPLRLAVSVALMFQVHLLSALFLILMYLPFFSYGWLRSSQKIGLLKHISLAIALFLVLTANVWTVFIDLNHANDLLTPFINEKMGQDGITGRAKYWLFWPEPLSVFLVGQVLFLGLWFRKKIGWELLLHVVYLGFLLLSTHFFPWQWLVDHQVGLAELIQFPFRFFVPATVLLLLISGLACQQLITRWRWLPLFLWLFVLIGFVQVTNRVDEMITYRAERQLITSKNKHVYLKGHYKTLKNSFFQKDKAIFLKRVSKATPDYVPRYEPLNGRNTYYEYAAIFIKDRPSMTKTVEGNRLVLQWTSSEPEALQLPIVVYQDSKMIYNGRQLDKSDYKLSFLGSPTIMSKKGENKLILAYKTPAWFGFIMAISLMGWLVLAFRQTWRYYQSLAF